MCFSSDIMLILSDTSSCYVETAQSLCANEWQRRIDQFSGDCLSSLMWKVLYVVRVMKRSQVVGKKGGCWKIHRTLIQQAFPWQHNSLWLKEPKASAQTQLHCLKDALIFVYTEQHRHAHKHTHPLFCVHFNIVSWNFYIINQFNHILAFAINTWLDF